MFTCCNPPFRKTLKAVAEAAAAVAAANDDFRIHAAARKRFRRCSSSGRLSSALGGGRGGESFSREIFLEILLRRGQKCLNSGESRGFSRRRYVLRRRRRCHIAGTNHHRHHHLGEKHGFICTIRSYGTGKEEGNHFSRESVHGNQRSGVAAEDDRHCDATPRFDRSAQLLLVRVMGTLFFYKKEEGRGWISKRRNTQLLPQ